MGEKRKINLSLDSKLCEGIEKLFEYFPWLAFESVEDFVKEAVVKRYEDLSILASQTKR